MARTPSTMPELGRSAAPIHLPDFDGHLVDVTGERPRAGLLVVFWCNHCPFVKHLRDTFVEVANGLVARGLEVVAINSNDYGAYPDDAPDRMREEAQRGGYRFPYLVDQDQAVARAYDAACTPDFFLHDRALRLVYRGQFDASRPGNGLPVTGDDLRRAADAVLRGAAVESEQRPSIGCNIKWKATSLHPHHAVRVP